MVVLLVLLTIATFLTIDIVKRRRREAALLVESEALHNSLQEEEPSFVGGFRLPTDLSYHPGHTWVHPVSATTAFVGIDDFARRILGQDIRITLPEEGTSLAQGKAAIVAHKGDTTVSMLSPIAGDVIAVNRDLLNDPELAYRDSYGRGWLFKVKAPQLRNDLANLLRGSLAKKWMEDTRERFQHQLTLATGSVIQDGGMPVEDISRALTAQEWETLVQEFLSPDIGGA